ncbi:fibronectin type III domain-containing protein [Microbacterium trichothecenolyticum]
MAFVDKATGQAGALRIDFDGTTVRFYVYGGYSTTNSGGLGWSGVVNGAGVGGSRAWPQGSYPAPGLLFGAWTANYGTQTVSFTLNATGTSGLGGPTTLTMTITREAPPPPATPPAAPHSLSVSDISLTSFRVTYSRGANNGAAIDQDHAEWSRVSDGVVVWDDAPFGVGPAGNPNGLSSPAGVGLALTPGVEYRVRVRSHNSAGWGPFSGYVSARTLSGIRAGKAGAFPVAELRAGKSNAFSVPTISVGKSGSFGPPT